MKKNILQNMLAATAALFTLMFAMPAQAQVATLLSENFDAITNGSIPDGWTIYDEDHDNNNWYVYNQNQNPGHSGGGVLTSASWQQQEILTPDNWIVTPKVAGAAKLTFWANAQDKSAVGDHFGVYASTAGKAVADFRKLAEYDTQEAKPAMTPRREQGQWREYVLELPKGTQYVAFRHFGCSDKFRVNIDDVLITGELPQEYGLKLSGEKVTSANCSDLSVIDRVSGTVKYDPATTTLTLNNATITGVLNEVYGIENQSVDNLIIKLIGKNEINCNDEGMVINATTNIAGSGSLDITSNYSDGIRLGNSAKLVVVDASVNVAGAEGGIAGTGNNALEIHDGVVSAQGDAGSICGLNSLWSEGSAITQPAGAFFDASLHGVALGGQLVKSKVVIEPVPQQAQNTVRIDGVEKPVLSSECTFYDSNSDEDPNGDNFEINLYLSDNQEEYFMIEGCKALHTDTDIDLTEYESDHDGQWYWLTEYKDSSGHKLFKTFGGRDHGYPVFDTGTLRIDGDLNGTFTVSLQNGILDGHTVSIKYTGKATTGINAVTTDNPAGKRGIYNLQGVRLGTSPDRLPKGVYIVDGKKVIKK